MTEYEETKGQHVNETIERKQAWQGPEDSEQGCEDNDLASRITDECSSFTEPEVIGWMPPALDEPFEVKN